uniref:Uncharacterized protein n=1 Tax=Leptocylindrus danicus TaxID=163516 RepID=A0A7S2PB88_9STRA|mmetsp:Transcript_27086/g.40026  ORF Transcript_27086/g.40026 Transcript_27086/m.40026 type:complete len:284 (+) Transcript_27086:345-1196(+)
MNHGCWESRHERKLCNFCATGCIQHVPDVELTRKMLAVCPSAAAAMGQNDFDLLHNIAVIWSNIEHHRGFILCGDLESKRKIFQSESERCLELGIIALEARCELEHGRLMLGGGCSISNATTPIHVLLGWCNRGSRHLKSREESPDVPFVLALLKKLIHERPSCVGIKDFNGNLPIHVAIENNQSHENKEVITALLRSRPSMTLVPSGDGKLPLIQAIEHSSCDWTIMEDLINADHRSLRMRDSATKLYPFMFPSTRNDIDHVTVVYKLLKLQPDIFSYFHAF